uniref:Uncharacterized protein n=1 Tax=Meloidogyne enterolobii TaxID=390850 RepID=A0A6V7UNL2_MELEN|nr:unnamed protein product [Meloidogyne enterolobii]
MIYLLISIFIFCFKSASCDHGSYGPLNTNEYGGVNSNYEMFCNSYTTLTANNAQNSFNGNHNIDEYSNYAYQNENNVNKGLNEVTRQFNFNPFINQGNDKHDVPIQQYSGTKTNSRHRGRRPHDRKMRNENFQREKLEDESEGQDDESVKDDGNQQIHEHLTSP